MIQPNGRSKQILLCNNDGGSSSSSIDTHTHTHRPSVSFQLQFSANQPASQPTNHWQEHTHNKKTYKFFFFFDPNLRMSNDLYGSGIKLCVKYLFTGMRIIILQALIIFFFLWWKWKQTKKKKKLKADIFWSVGQWRVR